MGSLADFLDYLHRTSVARHVEAAQARHRILQEAIREITGGHYPAGTPLVHIRCRCCGKHVATIEQDGDGKLMTHWLRLRRRFPGLPMLECPSTQRPLDISVTMIGEKLRAARTSDRPHTLGAFIRGIR
jgi:hypothetical protein